MNKSFIVKDNDGEFINGYNIAIGERTAIVSAKQCALRSKANVFEKVDNSEKMIYKWENGELNKIE